MDWHQADQTRPGIRDVMVRTRDGGTTWGDPTIVHQHATETAYAVDPDDPDHIFATTRIQRKALPGEDLQAIRKLSAMDMTPPDYMPDWAYKNGLLPGIDRRRPILPGSARRFVRLLELPLVHGLDGG